MITITEARKEILKSHPRIDAIYKVTGIAKYIADWNVKDVLYGAVIKSKIPHGKVKSIDVNEARKIEGVKDIVTCFDDNTIWNAGEKFHRRRVFTDHVRYLGDIIGAVAAETKFSAKIAAETVKVEYEEYPAIFKIEDAMKPDAPKIWEDGNVKGPLVISYGDIEKDFAEADLIFKGNFKTSRVANAQLEPAASLAWWEGNRLTVVAATQSIFGCREGLAKDLGIPIENVRVITYYKGGGFGNKASDMNYDLIAAILAKRTGRPVLIEFSREDEFSLVHGRWGTDQTLEAAVKKDGTILSFRIKAYADVGAYTRAIGKFVEGPESYYSTRSWYSEIYAVYTNTPPTGHMRAPPGPQSCFTTESLIDEIAYKLGVNPLDLRLKNAVTKVHNSSNLTSNGLRECLLRGAKEFNWYNRWKKPEKPKKGEIVRGVGMAMATWHARVGYGEAKIRLKPDGRVELFVGVVDIGTGAKTTMAMIVSRYLGVPIENIDIIWGDTENTPYSIGESGSRTTSFTGNAVKEASLELREKILNLASQFTGIEKKHLEIVNGKVVSLDSSIEIDIGDLLTKTKTDYLEAFVRINQELDKNMERLSFAAHFCEVEIDTETGEINVIDYLAVHDSGEIVNYLTAENQVKGGIVMGIGMALNEKLIFSDYDGSLLNGNFMTYKLPTIDKIPNIRVIFVETEDPYGPKSLGEVSIVPVPACIGNAIFNATSIRLSELPFSRETLLAKLDESVFTKV
ncbi:MAG: molybdopterin cofactor-binding domain-containing protein [Saccharolobus sp.]|uniref:xanthine dehydrogenase family protein molybdopterin-binding subunit n=1 Tax=Saccharolobus TaxID=2100760 RepID=UPI001F0D31F0|nr:molybdopterin cofactor-binding domain-containing protein [Saccharolobus shibatae]MCH4815774.1 molybdopterin-dependent oxidoreductase [Saccharolobus shibatae]